MTDKIKSPPPILICIAAIVVNLLGSFVAKFFALPIYLDTVGTIFVAMMSGYVPGVIVGKVIYTGALDLSAAIHGFVN